MADEEDQNDERRLAAAQHQLDIIQLMPRSFIRKIEIALGRFLESEGRSPSDSTIRRCCHTVRRDSEYTEPQLIFIKDDLAKLLTSDEDWKKAYQKAERDLAAVGMESTPDQMAGAMSLLFGMDKFEHYTISHAIQGAYFGYRLSANHGQIIRFFIRIWPEPSTGMLAFENHFWRGNDRWTVDSFGFDVLGTTYLLGQAKKNRTLRGGGSGLRVFALRPHRFFNWYVGPLLSMADDDPIAARVVLIPAADHRPYAACKTEDEQKQKILEFITSRASPKEIDDQVIIRAQHEDRRVTASDHVQSLIWNASFTTLHARHKPPAPEAIELYRQIFAMQRRATETVPRPDRDPSDRDDLIPFVRLAPYAEKIFPVSRETHDYRPSDKDNK